MFPVYASLSGLVMDWNVRIVYVPGSEVVQLEGLREMSLEVAAAAVGSQGQVVRVSVLVEQSPSCSADILRGQFAFGNISVVATVGIHFPQNHRKGRARVDQWGGDVSDRSCWC